MRAARGPRESNHAWKEVFIAGGEHINSNDMFISAEMGNRKREIEEMEKGKKVRIEFHARRNAALIVLDRLDHKLDDNIERLTNKYLKEAYQQISQGSSPVEGCASIKDGQHGKQKSSLSAVCQRERR